MLILCVNASIFAESIELAVSGAQQMAMPFAIIIITEQDSSELLSLANIIKKDLQFTEQFQPCIKQHNANLPTKELRKTIQLLASAGTPLALCIKIQSPHTIEWRLYDTLQCTMLQGKKCRKKRGSTRAWAHAIADEVWKTVTGNDGFFSSKLAYCKDSHNSKGQKISKIYIADFDGSNEELLVDVATIAIAPRWHTKKPQLSYSEYTDTNVRLMFTSLKKEVKTISALEGINMLASFAPNGIDYVYCASRGNGSCQIYLNKNNTLKRCTRNTGNNTSPVFIDEERICFCSDFQKGNPQIYIGNIATGHLQRITKGGYCTSPSYCPKTNKIVYHQMIHGTMQVMIYDCATKTHTQITSDSGNKHEASWSPDGTLLLYSHEYDTNKSRLVICNVLTRKTKYISSPHEYCSYPHWSPCY